MKFDLLTPSLFLLAWIASCVIRPSDLHLKSESALKLSTLYPDPEITYFIVNVFTLDQKTGEVLCNSLDPDMKLNPEKCWTKSRNYTFLKFGLDYIQKLYEQIIFNLKIFEMKKILRWILRISLPVVVLCRNKSDPDDSVVNCAPNKAVDVVVVVFVVCFLVARLQRWTMVHWGERSHCPPRILLLFHQ